MWLFEALMVVGVAGAVSMYLLLLIWNVLVFGMRAREVPALAWSMAGGLETQRRFLVIVEARRAANEVR